MGGIIWGSVIASGINTKKEIAEKLQYLPAPLSFANDEDVNPEFVINASAIIAASGTYVFGQPITWSILERGSAHGFSFFNGIDSVSGPVLRVLFPQVRSVLNGVANVDERGAGTSVFAGPSVTLNSLEIFAGMPRMIGTRLVADGAGNWTNANGNLNNYITPSVFGAPGAGETGVGGGPVPLYGFDADAIVVVYQGAQNYIVNRRYAGLGPYPIVFSLRDAATGALLVVPPAAGESVIIPALPLITDQIRLDIWYVNNDFMAGSGFNFWVSGRFEVWMFATSASGTENLIKYQVNYPGATNYKIYRDTDPNFGTQVLVHTGTEGFYRDQNLTPNTQYYYKLVAVVGIDLDVTTWPIRTPAV